MTCRIDRRSFLSTSVLAGATAVGIRSAEEKSLMAMLKNPTDPKKLKETTDPSGMPMGNLGDLKISRLIAGGNILNGWCHNRDLLYVSTLAGQYLTEEKKFDTLELYEENGINTCSPDPIQLGFINKYKQDRGGEIQTVVGVHEDWEYFSDPKWSRLKENIDFSIDQGATTLYIQGGYTEHLMKTGNPKRIEIIGKGIEYIKQQGFVAGLGGHDTKVIEIADKYEMDPDYYMKTFHHDRYWSAHPRDQREHWSVDAQRYVDHNKFHDNMFDLFPEKTIALMEKQKKPWIAFKTLAAGAIRPSDAFEFCFKNGADFLTVGMFDFQVVEDTLIAKRTLAMDEVTNRSRAWMA
jgi:hypothetical protein